MTIEAQLERIADVLSDIHRALTVELSEPVPAPASNPEPVPEFEPPLNEREIVNFVEFTQKAVQWFNDAGVDGNSELVNILVPHTGSPELSSVGVDRNICLSVSNALQERMKQIAEGQS